MNDKPCVFCGNPTLQVEGRKPRKYCSDTCRQKDWQKRHKTVQIKTDKQISSLIITLPAEPKEGETIQIKSTADIIIIKPSLPASEIFSTDYNKLLRQAKEGVTDRVAFKRHVDGIKLTPNQKAMIYSKLK